MIDHADTASAALAAKRPTARWLSSSETFAGLVGVSVTLALWALASVTLRNVPSPAAVLENAALNLLSSEHLPGIGLPRGGYLPHLALTAGNVLLGGGIGAVIGVATGLISASSRLFDEFTSPVVSLLGTTPIVIMAPFFLMWFGLSGGAQIALVAMYTATILHLFSLRGACNIAAHYIDYGLTLGARGSQIFWWIRLPGAAPEIFGGLRIAFAGAWGLAAVTEMLGGQFGSGRVISALRSVYDLTGIMAVVLLLGAMAMALDGLLVLARRSLLRWT